VAPSQRPRLGGAPRVPAVHGGVGQLDGRAGHFVLKERVSFRLSTAGSDADRVCPRWPPSFRAWWCGTLRRPRGGQRELLRTARCARLQGAGPASVAAAAVAAAAAAAAVAPWPLGWANGARCHC